MSLSLRDEEKPSMLEIGKRAPGIRNSSMYKGPVEGKGLMCGTPGASRWDS